MAARLMHRTLRLSHHLPRRAFSTTHASRAPESSTPSSTPTTTSPTTARPPHQVPKRTTPSNPSSTSEDLVRQAFQSFKQQYEREHERSSGFAQAAARGRGSVTGNRNSNNNNKGSKATAPSSATAAPAKRAAAPAASTDLFAKIFAPNTQRGAHAGASWEALTPLQRWEQRVGGLDSPQRLSPKTGLTLPVAPAVSADLAHKMRALHSSVRRNGVVRDSRAQLFHERPGLKRKRLRRQRWRSRFKASFLKICARVGQLSRQGW